LRKRAGVRVAESARQIWVLFLVPILAIFFLRDGANFPWGSDFAGTLPLPTRISCRTCSSDLNQMLAHFIRAQLTLAGLSMVAYASFLGILRVPYAMVLGTAGGVLEFVPVVGPWSPDWP